MINDVTQRRVAMCLRSGETFDRLYILNVVRCPYVCNAGRGQLSRQ